MFKLLIDYIHDEDGQTSTEYILLVAVVAMIVIKFKGKLNEKLTSVLDGVFQKVNTNIESDS